MEPGRVTIVESQALYPIFVGIKFDEALLKRIDRKAKTLGISRAAYIRGELSKVTP
jgi:hypothetical protein